MDWPPTRLAPLPLESTAGALQRLALVAPAWIDVRVVVLVLGLVAGACSSFVLLAVRRPDEEEAAEPAPPTPAAPSAPTLTEVQALRAELELLEATIVRLQGLAPTAPMLAAMFGEAPAPAAPVDASPPAAPSEAPAPALPPAAPVEGQPQPPA